MPSKKTIECRDTYVMPFTYGGAWHSSVCYFRADFLPDLHLTLPIYLRDLVDVVSAGLQLMVVAGHRYNVRYDDIQDIVAMQLQYHPYDYVDLSFCGCPSADKPAGDVQAMKDARLVGHVAMAQGDEASIEGMAKHISSLLAVYAGAVDTFSYYRTLYPHLCPPAPESCP